MNITKTTIIRRKDKHILTSKVGKDLVMINLDTGEYYGLDQVGNMIWEHIEEFTTLSTLYEVFNKRFNVKEEEFYNDSLNFINKLFNDGLIVIKK